MADRQEWEQATARSRQLAIAADAELRRRYPDQQIEPLHLAEPAPASDAERQHPDLIPHQRTGETARIHGLEVQQQILRTAMNKHRKLVPSEDAALGSLGEASPALRPPWRGCDLAAAPAADLPIGGDRPTRLRTRHRTRGWRLITAYSATVGRRAGRTRTVGSGICAVRAVTWPDL